MTTIEITNPVQTLHQSALDLSATSRTRAETLKILNILINLSVIISGAAITVASTVDDTTYAKWIGISLGLVITVGKSVSSIFGLEHKAVLLKQISNRARNVARNAFDLLASKDVDTPEYHRDLQRMYREFDELDMSAFSTTNGPFQKKTGSGGSSPTASV